MEQEYRIKGIEKIINTAGKERLAKYYGVDIDADFESIITEDLRKHNIPNGLEVALYFSLKPEEYNKAIEEGRGIPTEQDAAVKAYEQDTRKRAMFGFPYIGDVLRYDENDSLKIKDGTWGNVLYFFVDEPVKTENIGDFLYSPSHMVGGVQYQGLLMGNAYYEEHKDEIEAASPDRSKMEAVDEYIENFMEEFKDVEFLGGYGPRGRYEETDEKREEKSKNEQIILGLTGKSSIDELSLKDFIALKRRLEQEERELKEKFEEKFAKKESGERE